MKATM